MSRFFAVVAVAYALAVVAAIAGVLWGTVWAYNLDQRMVSDTVSAAIINTVAVAAMGFFGGFDMFFSIWQFMRSQEAERARNQEREEERKTRDIERKARETEREQERKAREAEREQERQAQKEFMAQFVGQLQAERERSDAHFAEMIARTDEALAQNRELSARVLELTQAVVQRANGHAGGDAEPTP